MDLLTLIETCSVADDFSLVLAIALTFSGGNPYTVQRVQELSGPTSEPVVAVEQDDSERREQALVELMAAVARGDRVVAGMMPATPEWAQALERPVEELLDPCAGLGIATATLSDFEYECGPKGDRACVLHKYARSAGLDFFAQDVLLAMKHRNLPAVGADVVVETDTIAEADVLVPADTERDWGADRILFPAPSKRPASTPLRKRVRKPVTHAASEPPPMRTAQPVDKLAPLRVPVAPLPPLPLVTKPLPTHSER